MDPKLYWMLAFWSGLPEIGYLCLSFCRDEEMDGEWEAPQVPNPKCATAPGCGLWVRPMKNNPKYKGKWKAPMIPNPNYQVLAVLYIVI